MKGANFGKTRKQRCEFKPLFFLALAAPKAFKEAEKMKEIH